MSYVLNPVFKLSIVSFISLGFLRENDIDWHFKLNIETPILDWKNETGHI